MRRQASVKTITEVEPSNNLFMINCFSDLNEDGSTTPNIYKSQVLDKTKIIDNVSGKEGELMLSHDSEADGSINELGELTIELSDDKEIEKYVKQQENLVYNE